MICIGIQIVKPDKAWSEFDTLNSERMKQLMDSRHSPNTPPIRTSSVTVQNNVITAPSATPSAETKNTQKDWSFWLVFGLLGLLVLLFVFLAVDRLYRHIQGYKTIEEQQQGGNNMRQYSDRA